MFNSRTKSPPDKIPFCQIGSNLQTPDSIPVMLLQTKEIIPFMFYRPGINPIQIINKMCVKLILTQFVWRISIFKNTYRRPSTSSPLKPLIGFWPNFTGMIPGWSPTKVVKRVLIGCISRSRGQKIGFQNAIFKNLLVWKYKTQSFYIWYIASSRGPLPKLFKLCPWGQNWPRPVGHNFTLNYIRKTSNDFLSWTAMVIWPNSTGMVPGYSSTKIFQMVLTGCISRSHGKEIGF